MEIKGDSALKLSGWTRLWIVATVIWWVGGGIALSQQKYAFTRGDDGPLALTYTMPAFALDTATSCTANFPSQYYASRADCLAKQEQGRKEMWGRWLSDSWDSGHLPFVLFGPLVLAGLWLARNWVVDGFRAPNEKKSSAPNPPDSP